MAAYGLAAILACFLQEVNSAEHIKKQPVKEFIEILKDTVHQKDLFLFLFGIALFSECHQTITVFLNQLQYVRSGMNDQAIALVYGIITVAGLLGMKSAAFSTLLSKRKAGAILFSAAALACLVITFAVNPLSPQSSFYGSHSA